jgi:hypothetical protein
MFTIVMMTLFLTALGPPGFSQEAQVRNVPELEAAEVSEILLFEVDGLKQDELVVERVERLHDRAKAYVVLRGRPLIVRLRCRNTDFGPRWGLERDFVGSTSDWQRETPAEAVPEQPTGDEAATTVEPPAEPAPATAEDTYKLFLADFIAALREGRGAYEAFYFRNDDFDLAASDEDSRASLERLARDRDHFVQRCSELSRALAAFRQLEIGDITAYGITDAMMNDLKPLMPGIKTFYNSAVINLRLDGRPGVITLEGVAQMPAGWRIGALADFELPQAQP